MASLSNINGIFDVHSTGAILFSTSHGTSGQILRSNGNAAPTWIPQSDIVGAYLPLSGGTLTGATATASGISFTVGGALTVSGTSTLSGGLKVIGPGSYNTIRSANDYTLGLDDSNGVSQWWFKAYTNGGFALHENTVGDKFTIAAGGAVTFGGSITAPSASIPTMSVNTNFAGDIFQYGSLKLNSTYINLGENALTKKTLSTAYFTNGTSNLACNIQFVNAAAQGYYKITLSGSYSYQDISGKLTKVIPFGYNPNGSIWRSGNNQSEITIATGGVSNNFTIGDLTWDSTASKFIIPIYKLSSNGNSVRVTVEHFGGNGNNLNLMTLSSIYTQAAPSPFNTRQYQNIRDRLGIGTNSPGYTLQVNGNAYVNSTLYVNGLATFDDQINVTSGYSINFGTSRLHSTDTSYFLGGNVGIGTSSPGPKLQVVQTIADWTGGFKNYTAGGYGLRVDMSGGSGQNAAIQAYTATGTGLIVKNNGLVGIGTFTPDYKLEVESTADADLVSIKSTAIANNTQMRLGISGNDSVISGTGGSTGALAFKTYGTERMRIKANGQIDFASPGTPNQSGISMFGGTNGGIMYMYRPAGQNGDIIRFQTAISSISSTRVGYINTTGSATTYNSASDYRLKENVTKITNALDRVNKLKPSRFNFIIEPKNTVDGFIAHEVQEIVPEAVTGVKDDIDENGDNHYQGMDNSRLVPLLTAAIQELEARIKQLENK